MQTAACLLLLLLPPLKLLLNFNDVWWFRNFDSASIECTAMRYVHLFAVFSTVPAVYIPIDLEEHIALACVKFPGVPKWNAKTDWIELLRNKGGPNALSDASLELNNEWCIAEAKKSYICSTHTFYYRCITIWVECNYHGKLDIQQIESIN